MKLLLGQDVYVVTARFLTGQRHDVVKVTTLRLAQVADSAHPMRT